MATGWGCNVLAACTHADAALLPVLQVCPVPDSVPAAPSSQDSARSGPSTPAAAGTQLPTAAAPAVAATATVQQLVHAWVLQQHKLWHPADAAAAAAMVAATVVGAASIEHSTPQHAAAMPDAAAPTPASQHDAAASSSGTTIAPAPAGAGVGVLSCAGDLPALPGTSNSGPAAAQQAGCMHRHTVQPSWHQQRLTLNEPVFPAAWQLQDNAPAQPPAAAISSLAAVTAYSTAKQACYNSSILAAVSEDSSTGLPGASVGDGTATAGVTCLHLPFAAVGLQGQQQQQLRLPTCVLPAVLPPVSDVTLHNSSQGQHMAQEGPAASILQPDPSAGGIVLRWLVSMHKPKAKAKPAAAAAEARVRRGSSAAAGAAAAAPHAGTSAAAARTGRTKVRSSMQLKPPLAKTAAAAAPPSATAAELDTAVAVAAAAPAPTSTQSDTHEQDHPQEASQGSPTAPAPDASCPSAGSQETQPGQLSQGSMLIEVPVYLAEQPAGPLNLQLLQSALSAAETALHTPVDQWELCELSAGAAMWDASWGDLNQQGTGSGTVAAAAGVVAATPAAGCPPAVLAMLSGAALQTATAGTAGAPAGGGAAGAVGGGEQPQSLLPEMWSSSSKHQQQQWAALGATVLEGMLAADMQLEDAASTLLLPVVLFPDTDDAWCVVGAAGGIAGSGCTCAELLAACGCQRQSTAHLELYFDWSLLQPQQLAVSKHSKRRPSSCAAPSSKRLRASAGAVAAGGHGQQLQAASRHEQHPGEEGAWLHRVLAHPGMQQLQQDLSTKQVPAAAATEGPATAAGDSMQDRAAWSIQQLAQWHSRQAFTAYLQECAFTSASTQIAGTVYRHSAPPALGHASPAPINQSSRGGKNLPPQPHMAAEALPAEVAAAAAAWQQVARQQATQKAASMPQTPGGPLLAAAVAKTPGVIPAPPAAAAAGAARSDLDFFMQLQATQGQRSKRRHSMLLTVPAAAAAPAEHDSPPGEQQGRDMAAALAAAPQVSLSPPAAPKRARVSVRQSQQQHQQQQLHEDKGPSGAAALDQQGSETVLPAPQELQHQPGIAASQCHQQEQQQLQQDAALATADLALNGVTTNAAAGQLAAAVAATAAVQAAWAAWAAGPSVITVTVSEPILKLLLQLDAMRRSVLASMQYPGPELVGSLLWQDTPAQQMLLQHKAQQQKQQQQSGQGPSAQQRQHNKQLVVLVLLSQTAACLLHYGIRVAHMFLQHGLQRLPSVAEACRPALAALDTAAEGIDKAPRTPARPATAGALGTSSSSGAGTTGGEHPKLAHLRELVLRLKSDQPVSKTTPVAVLALQTCSDGCTSITAMRSLVHPQSQAFIPNANNMVTSTSQPSRLSSQLHVHSTQSEVHQPAQMPCWFVHVCRTASCC